MPDKDLYVETEKVPPDPPKIVIQPGRSKENARCRGAGEEGPSSNYSTQKRIHVEAVKGNCSNCHQPGHKRRTSKNETIFHFLSRQQTNLKEDQSI